MKKHAIVFLATVLILSMFFVSMAAAGGKEEAPSAMGEKPFAGVTVRAILYDFASYDPFLQYHDEIMEKYGINFEADQFAQDAMPDKMWLELASGSGAYDIVYLSPSWKGTMIKEDYIQPINEYIEKYDIDLDGWTAAAMKHGGYEGGKEIWGLPFVCEGYHVIYRKDLFSDPENQAEFKKIYQYDLKPPYNPSTDEFLDYAEYFTIHNDDVDYGFFVQLGAESWKWVWTHHLMGTFGVQWWDKNYNSTIDSPEARAALEYGLKLMDYMPPEVLQSEWAGTRDSIREGQVAMAKSMAANSLESITPGATEFHDKMGFMLFPHHPDKKYGKYIFGGGAWSITRDSDNPEATFLVLQHLLADDARGAEISLAGGPMTRKALFEDPDIIATMPKGAEEVLDITVDALSYTDFDRIQIPPGGQLREQLAIMFGKIVTGQATIDEALTDCHNKWQEILEEHMQ